MPFGGLFVRAKEITVPSQMPSNAHTSLDTDILFCIGPLNNVASIRVVEKRKDVRPILRRTFNRLPPARLAPCHGMGEVSGHVEGPVARIPTAYE